MAALIIVGINPFVEVILQLLDAFIERLAEDHLIELLQYGFVEALADAAGFRRIGRDMLDTQLRQSPPYLRWAPLVDLAARLRGMKIVTAPARIKG